MHISPSDVFSSCYRSDESRSFTLLIRKSPVWGGTTCLQMGMSADARLFFSHDGVQVGDFLFSQACLSDTQSRTEQLKQMIVPYVKPSSIAVEQVIVPRVGSSSILASSTSDFQINFTVFLILSKV